jgi:hypothetical protein
LFQVLRDDINVGYERHAKLQVFSYKKILYLNWPAFMIRVKKVNGVDDENSICIVEGCTEGNLIYLDDERVITLKFQENMRFVMFQ